jgi:hypothetical protein
MRAKQWGTGAELDPAGIELRAGRTDETTNVATRKGLAAESQRKHHGKRQAQM